MARSALSSVINQQQNVSVGNTPIVKSYTKGIFENNSTLPEWTKPTKYMAPLYF